MPGVRAPLIDHAVFGPGVEGETLRKNLDSDLRAAVVLGQEGQGSAGIRETDGDFSEPAAVNAGELPFLAPRFGREFLDQCEDRGDLVLGGAGDPHEGTSGVRRGHERLGSR